MAPHYEYDAVVVGSGPNGLAAAITLAQSGASVLILEGHEKTGGGTRSAELTLPGFVHDVCSAIHPLGVASPFFRDLPLEKHGLNWIQPPAPLAHPLDGGQAVLVRQALEETAGDLGQDTSAYLNLFEPLVANWEALIGDILGPLSRPRDPLLFLRFGLQALNSGAGLARRRFKSPEAQALFSGLAAHSILPLEKPGTASFGLVLGTLAHAIGWPLPQGGSQRIGDALVAYLRSLNGEIRTGQMVTSLDELPPSRAVLLDVTPRQLAKIAGDRLPATYLRRLAGYRYGPGVFKVDFALDGPVPWQAAECSQAGTVHVGGSLEEITAAEKAVWKGEHPKKPFVLVAQQSPFDCTRAPEGKHTLWTYCHVPNGSTYDMTARIEAQIERFAPGFRDLILARHTFNTAEMEAYNPNYVGGDINGGVQDLRQQYTRPVARLVPYETPARGVYLCSSSTPPGGGVHGMCGYHAARAALRRLA